MPAIVAVLAFPIAIVGVKESGGDKGINVLVGNGANGGMLLAFLGALLALFLATRRRAASA